MRNIIRILRCPLCRQRRRRWVEPRRNSYNRAYNVVVVVLVAEMVLLVTRIPMPTTRQRFRQCHIIHPLDTGMGMGVGSVEG